MTKNTIPEEAVPSVLASLSQCCPYPQVVLDAAIANGLSLDDIERHIAFHTFGHIGHLDPVLACAEANAGASRA